jgi:hypothetical protein
VRNNHYYHDLIINYSLLSSWPDDFIPSQISDNISYINDPDHAEREGYVANLEPENFENDFQAASDEIQEDNTAIFSSGSVCTDLNGDRSNCDAQLLQTLTSFVESAKLTAHNPTTN